MYLHVTVEEPGLDEADHLPVARNAPKFGHRVFEKNIVSIDAVSLIRRKPSVIFLKLGNDIRHMLFFSTLVYRLKLGQQHGKRVSIRGTGDECGAKCLLLNTKG